MAYKGTSQPGRTQLLQMIYDAIAGAFGASPQDQANAGYTGSSSGALSTGATVYSNGVVANQVLKASAGKLVSLFGYNGGSAGFILLFDSASVPADGAVVGEATGSVPFAVPGTGNFSLDVAVLGLNYANGISIAYSTSNTSKTSAAANLQFAALIK